ncbi:phosphoenolpyruvate synthase, partial [Candidatus Shapirobacteria bacterium]|nr:phosphoenolpyruvate synthase [Candidatus Shapirobacteria bacterium]
MAKKTANILWFSQVNKNDVPLVGGKGANLGEMAAAGFPVPRGFIITSGAYFDFLKENYLKAKIDRELKRVDKHDPQSINEASQKIKKLILEAKISPALAREIIFNYLKLGGLISHALVAIRSSATAEDLPTASFAGQQKTFLNVKGEANVVRKVQECWASLFEARAIFYREEKGFDHFKVGIAVPIQEMIPAEISG